MLDHNILFNDMARQFKLYRPVYDPGTASELPFLSVVNSLHISSHNVHVKLSVTNRSAYFIDCKFHAVI